MADDDARNYGDERRRLLGELELERNQLIRNIETCRIRDIDRPFIGDWSLKDIVGHVVSWEAEYMGALRDIRSGNRPRTDAITAERPYRGALPIPKALEMMAQTVGTALDPECFDALKRAIDRLPVPL